ncbi:MAG: hypothetical protein KF780_08675 [Sphingomonas sp.]|nr:hypothetical protein [Sphingomonas sp.]
MIWFFLALTVFTLGSMIEFRTRGYPPLRPMPGTDAVWKVIGSISGVWLIVLFVWALFVFTWWTVPLLFIGAATLQGFFYPRASRAAAAPLLSMIFMIVAGALAALILYNLQAVAH